MTLYAGIGSMFPAHSRLLLHAHTNLVAVKLAAPLQTVPSHSAYPFGAFSILNFGVPRCASMLHVANGSGLVPCGTCLSLSLFIAYSSSVRDYVRE